MFKTIFAAIILMAVVVIAFYFLSDPFRTKIDSQIDQATRWTPENISEDPVVGYLTWAQAESSRTAEALRARKIALSQQKGKIERLLLETNTNLRSAEKLFVDFRDAYKGAADDMSWPTTIRDTAYTEPQLKNQIISLNHKIDTLVEQKDQVTKIRQTIDANIRTVDQRLAETKTMSTKLGQQLQIAKANKVIEDRADIDGLYDIDSLLSTTSELPTVDQLIEQEQASVSEEDFNKILDREVN